MPPWEALVVGGGPAGLAAGLHLARAGYRCLLVERAAPGGRALRLGRIENYPGFPAGIDGALLARRCLAQAKRWGLKVRKGDVRSVDGAAGGLRVSLRGGKTLRARAVVLCCGADFRRLGVPGETLAGVEHEADARGARLRGAAAVVGGGEAAAWQALALARRGAAVTVVHRGPRLKAHRLLLSRLERAGVSALRGRVERLLGRGRLESLRVVRPGGARERLAARLVHVLIGRERPALARRPPAGVFVAGDARGDRFRQTAVAAGDGLRAAMRAIRRLEGWR